MGNFCSASLATHSVCHYVPFSQTPIQHDHPKVMTPVTPALSACTPDSSQEERYKLEDYLQLFVVLNSATLGSSCLEARPFCRSFVIRGLFFTCGALDCQTNKITLPSVPSTIIS